MLLGQPLAEADCVKGGACMGRIAQWKTRGKYPGGCDLGFLGFADSSAIRCGRILARPLVGLFLLSVHVDHRAALA